MAQARGEEEQPDIATRIETVLGEFRMIIPALGALFGFQLTTAFSSAWGELPAPLKAVSFASVASTAVALVLLLVPASYHRFTRRLDESEGYLRFAQRNMGVAFVFIAASLTLSLYLQAMRAFGSPPASMGTALLFLLVALAGWWALPRRRAAREGLLHRHGAGKG